MAASTSISVATTFARIRPSGDPRRPVEAARHVRRHTPVARKMSTLGQHAGAGAHEPQTSVPNINRSRAAGDQPVTRHRNRGRVGGECCAVHGSGLSRASVSTTRNA